MKVNNPNYLNGLTVSAEQINTMVEGGGTGLTPEQTTTLAKLDGINSSASKIDSAVENLVLLQGTQEFNNLIGASNALRPNIWVNNTSVSQNCYLSQLKFKASSDTDNYATQIKIIIMSSSYLITDIVVKDIVVNTITADITIDNLNIYCPIGSLIGLQIIGNAGLKYGGLTGNTIYNMGVVTPAVGATLTAGQTIPSNTIAMYAKFNYSTMVIRVLNEVNNYLKGKKVDVIGDSMVKGHSLADSQTWLYKLAMRNNMQYTNYGINGAYLTNNGANSVHDRVTNPANANYFNPTNPDYILIFIGTNDASNSVTIGTEASTSQTEVYGALKAVITNLQTRYPTAKIGFITPYKRTASFPAYVTALENCCSLYGVPVFNNIKNGNVDWTNSAQISALTLNDTYHLNDAGMTFASYKYENFMRSL